MKVFSKAEDGIYKLVSDNDGSISYRINGNNGDALYFKIGPGIYLYATGETKNLEEMKQLEFLWKCTRFQ